MAEHGTVYGWTQHQRAGETPCDPCRLARNAYQRQWRQSRKAREAREAEARRRPNAAHHRALCRTTPRHRALTHTRERTPASVIHRVPRRCRNQR